MSFLGIIVGKLFANPTTTSVAKAIASSSNLRLAQPTHSAFNGAPHWGHYDERGDDLLDSGDPTRFKACSDGMTVSDRRTGLLWEKKTGTPGAEISCGKTPGACREVHDVNNSYTWSNTGSASDGDAQNEFLGNLNDPSDCFGGHCDWRLPSIEELQTILVGQDAAPGQATACDTSSCIDPDFSAIGGPTASAVYWSNSSNTEKPSGAWNADFNDGNIYDASFKTFANAVRAVRRGSCVI